MRANVAAAENAEVNEMFELKLNRILYRFYRKYG